MQARHELPAGPAQMPVHQGIASEQQSMHSMWCEEQQCSDNIEGQASHMLCQVKAQHAQYTMHVNCQPQTLLTKSRFKMLMFAETGGCLKRTAHERYRGHLVYTDVSSGYNSPWLASRAPVSLAARVGDVARDCVGDGAVEAVWVGPYRVSLMTATPPARCCTCCSSSLRLQTKNNTTHT